MLSGWYGRWMTRWETDLTTRDTNRIVRPLEWGFDWLQDFSHPDPTRRDALDPMIALNEEIVRGSDDFFGYSVPQDFRLEDRHPELFPTNVRPETLAQE